jgi:hypothetical protein
VPRAASSVYSDSVAAKAVWKGSCAAARKVAEKAVSTAAQSVAAPSVARRVPPWAGWMASGAVDKLVYWSDRSKVVWKASQWVSQWVYRSARRKEGWCLAEKARKTVEKTALSMAEMDSRKAAGKGDHTAARTAYEQSAVSSGERVVVETAVARAVWKASSPSAVEWAGR